MYATETVQLFQIPAFIIIGGFSAYIGKGPYPNSNTYNNFLFFSLDNGVSWFCRNSTTPSLVDPTGLLHRNQWMTPRSAAAVFSLVAGEERVVFIHGGRHYNGSGWANGGALNDVWKFSLDDCVRISNGVVFDKPCIMTQLQLNDMSSKFARYHHQAFSVDLGTGDMVIIMGGFAPDGNAAGQSDDPSFFANGEQMKLCLYIFNADPLIQGYFELGPGSIIVLDERLGIDPSFTFTKAALFAMFYSEEYNRIFFFGGTNKDITNPNTKRLPQLVSKLETYNDLWYLRLPDTSVTDDPGHFVQIKQLGALPSKRFNSHMLIDSGMIYSFSGMCSSGACKDASKFNLKSAHPYVTQVTGPGLDGGLVGQLSTFYIWAQTAMKDPADDCQSCFIAVVGGINPGMPSYYLSITQASEEEVNTAVTMYPTDIMDYSLPLNDQYAVYKAEYTPLASGSYKLSVTTSSSNVKDGLPRVSQLIVTPGDSCASTSFVTAHDTSAVAGAAFGFTVKILDAYSNPRPGGDSLAAGVGRTERLLEPMIVPMIDHLSGLHSVSLQFTRSGEYHVYPFMGVQSIGNGFSFAVTVFPRPALCLPPPGTCSTRVIGDFFADARAGDAKTLCVFFCGGFVADFVAACLILTCFASFILSLDSFSNMVSPDYENIVSVLYNTNDGSVFSGEGK